MVSETPQALAIHHIVHEYANFVSSAEMLLHGIDIDGTPVKAPTNTHVSHAFYLNCRKLADFFQCKTNNEPDAVIAMHFVVGYSVGLPISDRWRKSINKQLAHLTYWRDAHGEEITRGVQKELYEELKGTWQDFRMKLPKVYATEFMREVAKKKEPNDRGEPSEFRYYDLD